MSRRAPTPLRSAPSSGPMEAMVAKKQEQIEDLVAQNRTLDHTINRLRAALAEEQSRASDGVASLQKTFQQEREEWIKGCDAIQAIHRVAHARTVIELDRERMAALREREATRLEKLARLQRDFRLVGFQRREFDLEKRVLDLERELEDQQRLYEEDKLDLGEELEEQRAALSAQLQDTESDLAAALKAKESAEEALSKLRIEHNSLVASTSGSATDLERTNLHLEGLKSSHAELETKHAEAERTIADLRRQLEKWRTLESREGAEMDTLRRSRIELEVRVKELETRVEELEGDVKVREESMEKAKSKVAKYKASLDGYKTSLDEFQKALEEARAEADQADMEAMRAKERLQKAESEVQALRADLRLRPAKKPSSISDHEADENVSLRSASPPVPRRTKSSQRNVAPTSQQSQQANSSDDVEFVDVQPKPQEEVKRKRGRPRKKPVEEGEDGTAAKLTAGGKGKRKAHDAQDSDDEPPAKKSKKKTKVKSDEDDDDEPPKAKAKAKKPSAPASESGQASNAKPGPNKPKPGRKASASAVAPALAADEDEEAVPTPVKKKRKINLFPSSQPVSFDWNQLPQAGGGLDIPTTLSPVKETDAVPPRSVFGGRGSSAFGSFGSLGGRR